MPPVLDLPTLLQLQTDLGDADAVAEIAATYLAELPVRCARIRTARSRGDLAGLLDEIHALGSPSGLLGGLDLQRSCRELELTLRAGGADAGDPALAASVARCEADAHAFGDALTAWSRAGAGDQGSNR